jgi:hypothetical protein
MRCRESWYHSLPDVAREMILDKVVHSCVVVIAMSRLVTSLWSLPHRWHALYVAKEA